jgi:hypothetical protein
MLGPVGTYAERVSWREVYLPASNPDPNSENHYAKKSKSISKSPPLDCVATGLRLTCIGGPMVPLMKSSFSALARPSLPRAGLFPRNSAKVYQPGPHYFPALNLRAVLKTTPSHIIGLF